MKETKIILLFIIVLSNVAYGSNVSNYLEQYRKTENSDFNTEIKITEEYSFSKLVKELKNYYSDTVPLVQQKAYYLTYKKSLSEDLKKKQQAVKILINGCTKSSSLVTGYNLQTLKTYELDAFSASSKDIIEGMLLNKRMYHYKELVLLAGFVNIGAETIEGLIASDDINSKMKWNYAMALARMGSKQHIEMVLGKVKEMNVDNNLVEFILPQVIYIHQKEAVEYCFDIIVSNKQSCLSSNPDNDEDIICGYRVMELIAPAITNFPFEINSMGGLKTNDYEVALTKVREWYTLNKDFDINKNTF